MTTWVSLQQECNVDRLRRSEAQAAISNYPTGWGSRRARMPLHIRYEVADHLAGDAWGVEAPINSKRQ